MKKKIDVEYIIQIMLSQKSKIKAAYMLRKIHLSITMQFLFKNTSYSLSYGQKKYTLKKRYQISQYII